MSALPPKADIDLVPSRGRSGAMLVILAYRMLI
jgi:hypothetical protein